MNLLAKVLLTILLAVSVALAMAGVLAARGARQATQVYARGTLQEQGTAMAERAAAIYVQSASWDAAQAWLDSASIDEAMAGSGMTVSGMTGSGMESAGAEAMMGGGMMGRGMMRGSMRHMARMHSWTIVAANDSTPLAAQGETVLPAALALASPVLVGGQAVARVAPNLLPSGLTQAEEIFLAQMLRALWIAALVAGVVAVASGSLLAANILRPLRRVETTVETIAHGDLAARVQPIGRDEIGRLAEGVNKMAAGLQRQEELRQRMVSDIAHELRTPLSVIQGNLQAILDGVYPLDEAEIRILFDESRLLGRLVEELHELALAEAFRLPLNVERLDVATALAQAVDGFRALAEGQSVRLDAAPAAPLAVRADAGRLQQILHNLVANALRHTPAGGHVLLDAQPAGQQIRFAVRDSGAGIASGDLPHIFDRFYRAERDRTRDGASAATHAAGAGLGLAIVKALVEAQGGRVGAESEPARGAIVWFSLPAA